MQALLLTPRIVFHSSRSENTLRFVNKLNLPALRLPVSVKEDLPTINDDFILITPTYGGGKIKGSIPPPVMRFLNVEASRSKCVGVVTGGNTTFGAGYGSAGDLIAAKLKIPHLHKFEVLGMPEDVEEVREIMFTVFPELGELRGLPANSYAFPSYFS